MRQRLLAALAGPYGLWAVGGGVVAYLLLFMSSLDVPLGDFLFGSYFPRPAIHIGTMSLGFMACLLSGASLLLNPNSKRSFRMAGGLIVLGMAWDLVCLQMELAPTKFQGLLGFYIVLLMNAAISVLLCYLVLIESRIHKKVASRLSQWSGLVYVPAFILAHFDNLLPIRYSFSLVLATRLLVLAGLPSLVAWMKVGMETGRTERVSIRKWSRRWLKSYLTRDTMSCWHVLSLASFAQVVTLLSSRSKTPLTVIGPWESAAVANVVVLVLSWFMWRQYTHETKLTQENHLLARLNPETIKRFIRRYKWRDESWATTIGVRTASYTIDHDPDEQVTTRLPATMVQIRREEIDRCVDQVIGNKLLHKQQVGNQIIGIVDSETSMSPCVEVLMLFTCIYLDATPLVERRLKALASLFPILDPGLASFLTPSLIDESLSRVQWIFHFDYDWVDQQMITTPGFVRYGVNLTSLRSQIRLKIIEHLKNRHYLGNFIWVGDRARQQLLFEAPFLAPVIEACPLAVNGTEEDTVIFIIKFEELIPRMQRYYPLEHLRTILNDYEPSAESRAFLKVAEFQIAHSKSVRDLELTLDHLLTHSWIGFKEKDMALRLVLHAFDHASALLKNSLESIETFRTRCFNTIETIGYPSQMLHYAEMNKRKIRSPQKVMEILADEGNERFADTWLFLASTDLHRNSLEELQEIIQVLILVYQRPSIRAREVVQLKFIPAYFNVCRHILDKDSMAVANTIELCAHLILQHKLDINHLIYFLDAHSYLQLQTQQTIALQDATYQLLKKCVASAMDVTGSPQPLAPALQIRWRSYEKLFNKFLQAA